MADQYKLSIKLIENQRPCNIGHQVGTEWLYEGKAPAGLCMFAYNALYPFIQVLSYGGNFHWQQNPDVIIQSCPDHEVVNKFELRRIPETGKKAKLYGVSLKLVGKDAEGTCGAGHRAGDEWMLGEKTPENICPSAFASIYIPAMVLRYGGQFPWQQDPDVTYAICPDSSVGNRFEIRRVPLKKPAL